MPELDTAGKFRRIADLLATRALDAVEGGDPLPGPVLQTAAKAGKEALEAAAMADVGETEIARILRGMREELEQSGAIDPNELATLTVEEVLRLTALTGKRGREIARTLNDTRTGFTVLEGHVRRLRDQALEAKGQGGDEEAIDRVVARHEQALVEAKSYVDRRQT